MNETAALSIAGEEAGSEFDRFVRLFDNLVAESVLWIESAPSERLEWTPPTDNGIHFGSRLRHATIKTLFVHMAVAERFWVERLKDCADGDPLPLPRDMNRFHAALDGDFVDNTKKLHAETLDLLAAVPAEQLAKRITFAGDGTRWSVMGFFWGIWGHRAYHLGNLDMLVRMIAGNAPDFFSFPDKQMA